MEKIKNQNYPKEINKIKIRLTILKISKILKISFLSSGSLVQLQP